MAAKVKYDEDRQTWAVVIHHNGKKKYKAASSKDAADGIARTINERLDRRALGLIVNPGETFQPYAERYLRTRDDGAGLKASSHAFYDNKLTKHVYDSIGTLPVSTITHDVVKELLTDLKKAGVKAPTRRGVLASISVVLTQAVEDGLLTGNPAFRKSALTKDADAVKKKITPYTRDEAKRLLEATLRIAPDWYGFLLMALRAGLRLGELLALTWDDLDLVAGTADLCRSFTRGKFTSLKNKRERTVDLSPQLVEALIALRAPQRRLPLQRGKERPALVFPGRDMESVRDAWAFRKKTWKRIQRAAELKLRRLHDCRHTYAALLLSDGAPVNYVKEQMGHSSITVTVDTYGKFMPSTTRPWVTRLDDNAPLARPAAAGETVDTLRAEVARLHALLDGVEAAS